MKLSVVFYDLADKWVEEIESDRELTCAEAAALVLERNGRPSDQMNGLIYRIGTDRAYADDIPEDGACLSVHRLLGGG